MQYSYTKTRDGSFCPLWRGCPLSEVLPLYTYVDWCIGKCPLYRGRFQGEQTNVSRNRGCPAKTLIGRAGASPPSCTTGANFLYSCWTVLHAYATTEATARVCQDIVGILFSIIRTRLLNRCLPFFGKTGTTAERSPPATAVTVKFDSITSYSGGEVSLQQLQHSY